MTIMRVKYIFCKTLITAQLDVIVHVILTHSPQRIYKKNIKEIERERKNFIKIAMVR